MLPFLQFFILWPLAGFLLSLWVPRKKERLLSGIAIGTVGAQVLGALVFAGWWWLNGRPTLDIKQVVLYQSPEFEFYIDFYFDNITAVFAVVGAVLALVIAIFSKFYMHRESGFKRFFTALLLFFTGYNLVVFAGNFETLFVGWEILGITSFLLIAFYRDRYLPVKNGFKVLSFYRLGDICLILAMWMCHHLWYKNIAFSEWSDVSAMQEMFQLHDVWVTTIGILILVAASIKSAQLPFFTWLPRAMEGPTTSSAIFYGSLSVHIGVFLLLRTYPFWEYSGLIKGLVISVGLLTSLVASSIARVQSSVKTQIAYSSIAQIGLMFIEVALGFHLLALLHFASNAFLRTYQLLVSPSVLSYRVHDMFFNFVPRRWTASGTALHRFRQALYILSVKEWNFDFWLHRYLWRPFKWIGNRMRFLNQRGAGVSMALVLMTGAGGIMFKDNIHIDWYTYAPEIFAGLSLLLLLKAFSERGDASNAWQLAFFSQIFTVLAILLDKDVRWQDVVFYLSGTVVAAVVGYVCLRRIRALEGNIDLNEYHGHSYEHAGLALVFLISCLGMAGFPISPTFIGVDLMFTHISAHNLVLVFLSALNLLFLELTLLRIYTRIFLGQHKKTYHPIAFKSS
ncbi:MAG: hypothetical protein IT260_16960 [Saprospiraceae bacterium]|nr:hypothetical protein [Saprospiraceae bacterium]